MLQASQSDKEILAVREPLLQCSPGFTWRDFAGARLFAYGTGSGAQMSSVTEIRFAIVVSWVG